MKFLNPGWLWGLIIIPLFYLVLILDEKKKGRKFSEFIHPQLWPRIVPEWDPRLRLRKLKVGFLAFVFALIALARPQFGSHEESVHVSGLDLVLVLDVSSSMETEDVIPSRLAKSKHAIHKLLEHLEGDRVGVVAFAGSSFVASPLTTDLDYVWQVIQGLGPRMIKNQGTDIGLGLETGLRALERGAEERSSLHQEDPAATRILVLISDGEDHEGLAKAFAKKLHTSGVKLYVLGVGTEKGAPIPIKDENGNSQGFKRGRSGEAIISSFHPEALIDVANAANGNYWNLTTDETELTDLLQKIGAQNRSDYMERKYTVYLERFQIPLLISIILFLLEISLPVRKILIISVVFLGVSKFTTNALAVDFNKFGAPLDIYLENEKGLKALQEGKADEAQKSFGAAQARDPSLPELEFNQGVAQLKSGETDQAVQSFSHSAMMAKEKNNRNLLGRSLYNLGDALVKKGDMQSAVRAYIDAVEAAQTSQDPILEARAKKNLQLLQNEIKKQKQQKQQAQQQKNQNQKESDSGKGKDNQEAQSQQGKSQKPDENQDKNQEMKESQNSQKDDKNQSQKDKSSGQEKRYQQNSKEQFKSGSMSQEDAEKVMSELVDREQKLQNQDKIQENFRTQNAKPHVHAKDW